MHRARSRGSETEEPSEEDLMHVELSQLQRRYRTMQNDYRAYREATKRIISKQDSLINNLGGEQDELLTCMSKMETTQNRNKDDFNTAQLMELARFEKRYQALIQEEGDKSKALDAKIGEVEKQITEQRKKMGGVHISTTKYIVNNKKRRVLENRLDKAMVLFNQQLAINSKLRGDIDHLRRERSVFNNLYKKLSKELNRSKRAMAEVIEASTQAFEQRDEAQSKMTALQERNDKDQHQHYTEMKELNRIISHDDKIKEFMTIKASDRQQLKAEEAEKKRKMRGDSDKSVNADIATIQQYQEGFKKIQEVTGQESLDEIADGFIRTEDQNFALFNYVNELNSEVESLIDQVAQIRTDIELFKAEDAVRDGNHKVLIKRIEVKYNGAVKTNQGADTRLKEINKVLDQLMSQIFTIFQRLSCDPRPIQEMLGDEAISQKNVMIYLGLIEQNTTELTNIMHYLQSRKSVIEGVVPAPPAAAPVPAPQQSLVVSIIPPSTEGEDDDEMLEEEDNDKPLTKSELRLRVSRGLNRRTILGPQQTPPSTNAKGRTSRNTKRPASRRQ